jgi:hypothetical protein
MKSRMRESFQLVSMFLFLALFCAPLPCFADYSPALDDGWSLTVTGRIPEWSERQRAIQHPSGASISPKLGSEPPIPLPDNPPAYYELGSFQSPVKDQDPRGSCPSFAWAGAMEAFYKRAYGLDLDLSEEYLIHVVHTVQHSYNPSSGIENIPSFCTLLDEKNYKWTWPHQVKVGEIVMTEEGLLIPEEKYAPYFGNIHANSASYPNHSYNDFLQIANDHGLVYWDNPTSQWVCDPNRTQKVVDGFEYDARHIPIEARKNAYYGVSKMMVLDGIKARDTTLLEKLIYSWHEVSLGVTIDYLDCDKKYSDGNAICRYNANANNSSYHLGNGGHQLLLVGYDRSKQVFLFKNSWANNHPWIWITYDYLSKTYPASSGYGGYLVNSGFVILDVFLPPSLPELPMWKGQWKMDHDGWLGDLTLRRTRKPISETISWNPDDFTVFEYHAQPVLPDRVGTYLDAEKVAHEVTGNWDFDSWNFHYFVDFANPEPAPDPLDTLVNVTGQEFSLSMFSGAANPFTQGNFAAGTTHWNGHSYGTLLSRPQIELNHPAGSFQKKNWLDRFKVYFSNGEKATLEVKSIGSFAGGKATVNYKLNSASLSTVLYQAVQHALPIKWGNTSYTLYYHTHEKGILSGQHDNATADEQKPGVIGLKASDLGVTTVTASKGTYTGKVHVTWSAVAGAKGYEVLRKAAMWMDAVSISGQLSADKLQFDDYAAAPGWPNYYSVKALVQEGDWSDPITFDEGYRKLLAPSGVAASQGKYLDKVRITWKASQGAISYSVYRALSPLTKPVSIGQTTDSKFDDKTAAAKQTYYYSVAAGGLAGSSDRSKAVKGYRKQLLPIGDQ